MNTHNLLIVLLHRSEVAGEEASPLIVEHTGGPDSTHAEFFASLPDDEPRVAVYDLKFSIKTSDGAITEKNKILVISWVPTGIKPGMRGNESGVARHSD
jgi:hypothetical protein